MPSSRVRIPIVFILVFISLSGVCRARESGRLITIPDGIAIVLKDSRLVKIAQSQTDMALDDSLAARSGLLPRISGFAAETFLANQPASKFDSAQVNTAEKRSFTYGFDIYQTVFDFKRSILTHQASRSSLEAQKAVLEQTKRVAVLGFILAYFDVLESEKMILVAQKQVESISAYAADVEHMFEQGVAIKNDVLAAQVRLADARQQLIAARNSRENAISRLSVILALPLAENIRVEDIRMGVPTIPAMEDAWKQAQGLRPEVTVIDQQSAAADASRRARLTGNYPTLYVDGGYDYTQNKYQVQQDNVFMNLGAKADLYDGGLVKAQALKERDLQKLLAEQRAKLIDDIRLEVKNSFLGVNEASEKVNVTKGSLEQAAENVRVNRKSFTEGATTSVAVLDAIAMETLAQTNYYRADYQLKREYTKFMYATGIDLALVYESMQKGSDQNGK